MSPDEQIRPVHFGTIKSPTHAARCDLGTIGKPFQDALLKLEEIRPYFRPVARAAASAAFCTVCRLAGLSCTV